MQAHAALYLPVTDIDLAEVVPGARRASALFGRKSAFRVPFKDTHVRFNVMPGGDVPKHLQQFVSYIDSLEDSPADKEAAKSAVLRTRTVLGLDTDIEFEGNEAEFGDLLEKINDHYKGCVFMFDSVVLHGGQVLVGPLKESTE